LARAIEGLVDDPRAMVALGLEAQRQAAAYDWEAQKSRYVAIVDRLVDGTSPTAVRDRN
jgi:hypothetical protein